MKDKRSGNANSDVEMDSSVSIIVDLQRLHVLLRRETTNLRKLLQMRDFVALKTNGEIDESGGHGGSNYGDANTAEGGDEFSLLRKIKQSQLKIIVLETAINNMGKIKIADVEKCVHLYAVGIVF